MWDFISEQILGMQWLYEWFGTILSMCGINIETGFGHGLHFFVYDVVKIVVLLSVMIFVIGYIQSYFPPERSKQILSRFKGIKGNILSALLGTITPFCSCSSIPLFIGFTRAGLPLGVTFSFLISSPMVDIGSFILLTSIFGFEIAVLYILTGLVIAVLGGTMIEKMGLEKEVEDLSQEDGTLYEESLYYTTKERLNYAKIEVLWTVKKVVPYICLGVAIGAGIHNWIPQNVVENILGENNPFGVILSTMIGVPMYADIFGVIPIAEALLEKGSQLGTVLAFMMSVTALSLPSMIILRKALKPKLLGVFIGICTIGIILVGYSFNFYDTFLM